MYYLVLVLILLFHQEPEPAVEFTTKCSSHWHCVVEMRHHGEVISQTIGENAFLKKAATDSLPTFEAAMVAYQ